MVRVGIIGATGYAGGELVRILLNHKDAKIVWYGSRSYIDKKYYQVYQNMFQLVEDICKDDNLEELAKQVDVIFTATPQGFLAGLLTEEILSQVKIVDLSADYRIKDVATYEKWYGIEHKSPQFIEEAVYGLCEINRDKITEKTRLVANPGCYTTCSILTAYPMVKEGMIDVNTLIIFLPHTHFIAFLCHRIASQQAAPAILLWNRSDPIRKIAAALLRYSSDSE